MTPEEVKIEDLNRNDIVIAVMGPTGAGMSTFISIAAKQDERVIGLGLKPFTTDCRAVRVMHPRTGQNIVFVDTPGFDDSRKSDLDVLKLFRRKNKNKLAGIIYLHRICDNRGTASATPARNFGLFADLCGKDVMQNVVLATTMWNLVDEDEGRQRENELKEIWNSILAKGSVTTRFMGSFESAWDIVDVIVDKIRNSAVHSSEGSKSSSETQSSIDRDDVPSFELQRRLITASEITDDDFLVVLFGPSGTGKSSFISAAIGTLPVSIGYGLEPCTVEIQCFRCIHPHNGRSIVFVDTPAPNACMKMADWLCLCCLRTRSVDGILYMHRISDERINESPRPHFPTFQALCGPAFRWKSLFVTTMWGDVDEAKGQRRCQEICTKHWKMMMEGGSKVIRFDNTARSAWSAVGRLLSKENNSVS